MTALNATALAAIRNAGFTRAEWLRMWGYGDSMTWGGDRCGCFDDRCIGFHHEGAEGCGCLETMIDDAVAWRAAATYPNTVTLTGRADGLNRWVTVSTPHVLATVSTSKHWTGPIVNGARVEQPEGTSIRLEPREGWSAVVGEDELYGRKQMVIRFVRTPVAPGPEEAAAGDER